MIFFGSLLSADVMSVACTPTCIDDINKVELSNGIYDEVRITKDVKFELTKDIPQGWDFDTILHATFDGDGLAGNIKWAVDSVSDIAIKRRKVGEFKWITLETKKVYEVTDFSIVGIDKTAAPNYEYEYAVVPVLNGMEGNYSPALPLKVKTDCLVVIDKDEMWTTTITDGFCDEVSNAPNSTVTTMNDRYPTIVSNTSANYKTITVNCQLLPTEDNGEDCSPIVDDLKAEVARITDDNNAFMDFLNNRKPKLLKNIDGRMWLVYVTTPPTNSADETYLLRKITFGCTEIGNIVSEEDLYYSGFITATEEWWNQ